MIVMVISVSPKYNEDLNLVKEEHLHCVNNLHSISNVDFSHVKWHLS